MLISTNHLRVLFYKSQTILNKQTREFPNDSHIDNVALLIVN